MAIKLVYRVHIKVEEEDERDNNGKISWRKKRKINIDICLEEICKRNEEEWEERYYNLLKGNESKNKRNRY